MSVQTVKLYSLPLVSARTLFAAVVFTAANIAFPQLVHLVPGGGFVFLPIYFFTIVGAYKYGLYVGLMTAALSPLANNLLFGMPPAGVLPVIMFKSVLAAVAASYFAKRAGRVALWAVLLTVVSYQVAGSAFEWAFTGSLAAALADFRTGVPGMLLQVFAGYALLRVVTKS